MTMSTTIPEHQNSNKIYHLYVKTHSITRLKYLGFTSSLDPHRYLGSGVRWRAHLNKHGHEHETEILLTTSEYNAIVEMGKYYSNLWNVVKSDKWANLKEEVGDGGAYEFTPEDRARISQGLKGKPKSPTAVAKIVRSRKLNGSYVQSPKSLAKRSAIQRGRPKSLEHRAKIAAALKGRKKTPEHIKNGVASRRRNRTALTAKT